MASAREGSYENLYVVPPTERLPTKVRCLGQAAIENSRRLAGCPRLALRPCFDFPCAWFEDIVSDLDHKFPRLYSSSI